MTGRSWRLRPPARLHGTGAAQPGSPAARATQPAFPPAAFRQLASAATISGLGDGVTQVAGALLALSLTRSPLRLAGLLAAQQLPWALGALPAGALVDRVDRRRAMAAGRVISAVGAGPALRAELVVEALSYLGLLLTRAPVAAAALLAFLAANLTLFSSAGAALRQSLAPPGMLGRVQGAYRTVSNGGMLAGAALGGLLTTAAGLTAPLWLGLAASTAMIALAWRAFGTLR